MLDKFKKTISNNEMKELFLKVKNGDNLARDELIECNLRLVSYRVYGRFCSLPYDKDDMISIGIIGLIKAIDTFDISRNREFAAYAVRCIDNEILMFFRKEKRESENLKLDDELNNLSDDDFLTLGVMVKSDENIEEDYENKNMILNNQKVIREVLEGLNEQDRECLKMYFGFNGKPMKQKDIAIELGISRSYVSRIVLRAIEKIRNRIIIDNGYLIDKSEILSGDTKNNTVKDTGYEIIVDDIEERGCRLIDDFEDNFDIAILFKLINTFIFRNIMNDVISNEEVNMLFNLLDIDVDIDDDFPFNKIEVNKMFRKILLIYKDRLNMYMDDISMILCDDVDSCKYMRREM